MAEPKRIVAPTGKIKWEIRFWDHSTGGQRRSRYVTKELAERALAQAVLANQADPHAPANRELTVAELVAEEAATSNRTVKTAKTRKSYFHNHVPDWFMDRTARWISIEDVEAILNVAGKTLCLESVKKLRGILSSVFTYGVSRRVCDRVPTKGARITAVCQVSQRARKMVDHEVDPDEIPSPEQAWAISDAIIDRFRIRVYVMWTCGLRLGEVIALNVTDWNPRTGILRVWRSGPGTDRTKGHRAFRDVIVPPNLAEELDLHISEYCSGDGPLFPGPRGGRLTQSNFRKRYFYPAVDIALGQDAKDDQHRRRIRPHDLRHTAANYMYSEGVPEKEISYQLGHASVEFTQRVYYGVWRRQEREISNKLNDSIGEFLRKRPSSETESACQG